MGHRTRAVTANRIGAFIANRGRKLAANRIGAFIANRNRKLAANRGGTFIANRKTGRAMRLLNTVFYAAMVLFAAVAVWRVCRGSGFFMDTAEHIHSSWLVSIGKVPYRDFFQHHNPLLWYLFAPVTQLFYRDTAIVYAARVAAILGWGAVLYKLYALVCAGFGGRAAGSAGDESGPRAVADAGFSGCRGNAADVGLEADAAAKRMTAQWALLFLLALSPLWKDVQNLCPDIFMLWGMLAGTERFFAYLDGQRQRDLVLSYLWWTAAFLFLQKAVFPGAGFAAANLWLLLRGRVRFADCAAASAAALAVLAAAAAYFWHEDALKQWFDYNFLFNRQVAAYYGSYTSGVGTALKLCAAGTAAAVIRFCRCGEKETAWLLLLAGCAGILFVFAPHPRYYVPYFLLAAPYVGRAAMRLMAAERLSGRLKKAAIAAAAAGFAVSLWTLVPAGKKASAFKKHMALAEYVIRHTAPDEALLNGVNAYAANLYNPDADYFWFGFHNTVKIAAYWGYGKFDYNTAIKRHKPKILLLGEDSPLDVIAMSQTKWLKERNLRAAMLGRGNVAGRNDFIRLNYSCWNEDMDYIKKHYDLVEAGSEAMLWVRKDGSGTGNGGGSGQ